VAIPIAIYSYPDPGGISYR